MRWRPYLISEPEQRGWKGKSEVSEEEDEREKSNWKLNERGMGSQHLPYEIELEF